ncbi:low affinity immunoglobulin epsilon Fc receptor-like [Styela clava]
MAQWKSHEGDDPNEDCACISSSGWIDVACTGGTFKYICQSYPNDAITDDGDLLEKFDNKIRNAAARSRCSLWNGNLVDMKTQTYNNKVQQLIGNSGEYQIGLKYFDGEYRWTDGSSATYDDWGSGEGDKNNGQDCVKSGRDKWYDVSCGGSLGYICQTSKWCTGNSCKNEGSCVSNRCECTAGYFSDTCASNEYCSSNVNPCQNEGSCENMPGIDPYYKCKCEPEYFDDICSTESE